MAAHDRLRRRQGPRDAQVRRQLHVLRARRRLPRHEVASAASRARSTCRAPTTTARSRACAPACRRSDIGIPQGYPDYVLHKMVTVMHGGEEVKISKRAGSYVTVRDLIDEVGRDAVRFFLMSRKADSRVRVRHRPRALAVGREPGLLRPVRARARRVGAAAGGHCARRRARRCASADLSPLVERVRGARCCAGSPTSPTSSRWPRASSRRTSSRST